jgi:hypothetical protein
MHPCALAAQIARIMALTALIALGLSDASFHEPFHAEARQSGHPVTVRNLNENTACVAASVTAVTVQWLIRARSLLLTITTAPCTERTGSTDDRENRTGSTRSAAIPGDPVHKPVHAGAGRMP